MKKILAALTLVVAASCVVAGYAQQTADGLLSEPKATPAYEALVLRKVSVEAELENLSATLRSTHPQLTRKRFEFDALGREMERMAAIEKSLVPKLSSSYGTLILRKVALEVELHELLNTVTSQHPRATAKRDALEALEREIEKIMQ